MLWPSHTSGILSCFSSWFIRSQYSLKNNNMRRHQTWRRSFYRHSSDIKVKTLLTLQVQDVVITHLHLQVSLLLNAAFISVQLIAVWHHWTPSLKTQMLQTCSLFHRLCLRRLFDLWGHRTYQSAFGCVHLHGFPAEHGSFRDERRPLLGHNEGYTWRSEVKY